MKTLSPPGKLTPTDDQRRDPRRRTQRTTGKLFATGNQKDLLDKTVTMMDLSLHGVGFRSTDALTVGMLYGLEIRGNWMNLSSRIRVVSCRLGKNDEFEIGAEFC